MMIRQAIAALENAREIFSLGQKNQWGKALTYYQLGFLYETKFDTLIATSADGASIL